ncbi:hypothetical protein GOV14_05655 [Candidatus Pacearchaeota archaeon]|nr:hypothetical protein [Candidatus Pacearchaeota archaeon]
MEWETIERPGYLGKKRDEVVSQWDKKFGENNWRIAYQWGDLIIPRKEALQIYEDGYYEFFKRCSGTLDWLIDNASDIYDTEESNIKSKFNYEIQETENNHIHDIAIRRAVLRNGVWFKGDHLMHVRWKDTEGYRINPGIVAFHLPHMIVPGEIKDYGQSTIWWKKDTIEDFYQRNKLLQIKA